MNYLFISKFDTNNKVIFVQDETGNEIRPVKLGSSEPRLMAITDHNSIEILTRVKLGKKIFDSLYCLSNAHTEFVSPCFSFKKGEETDLAIQLDGKYAFAYLDNTFKYYDRHTETWRKVRHFFEDKEQELAFKALAQKGSFVLRLDRLSIEDFFNANDVLNNN